MTVPPFAAVARRSIVVLAALVATAVVALAAEYEKPNHNNTGKRGPSIIIDIIPGLITRPATPGCRPPAVYSKKAGGCVIPPAKPQPVTTPGCQKPAVWSKTQKRCVIPAPPKRQASCQWPLVKSGSTCVCAAGYVSSKGICVKSGPKPPAIVVDVRGVQECLVKLGYDPGPVDGDAGKATSNAFRAWQTANGLAARPASLSDKESLAQLYAACGAPPVVDASYPEPAAPVPPAVAAPGRCLPEDLYALLVATYGAPPPGIAACRPETAICLPKPIFYSEAKLAAVSSATGIRWCDACISLGTWLPLKTIYDIEAAANITLCAAPPALCYVPRPGIVTRTEVRTIYKALPVSVGNEGDIAVVVGNETYRNGVTPNVYGHADADAVVQLLTEQLGYRKENIIDLRDATEADLERVFGTATAPEGELARRITADQPGDVIVYVSSHGLSTDDGAGYLLPVDADTANLATTAYPLQQLYVNLGRTGARTTMLMLEATFARSVTDMVDPPNIPESEVMAMPATPVAGLAVFTAADRDQRTLKDPEYGIGLFTRYLIAGLAGEADAAPIGNGDKRIDTVELFVYASDMVRTAARKSFGLEQKPLLSKIDNLLVGRLAAAE